MCHVPKLSQHRRVREKLKDNLQTGTQGTPQPPVCPYNKHIRNQPMTATFADYVAQQDARNTIQLNVTKWCYMLIDALKDNYREYAIRGHQKFVGTDADTHEYHQRKIDELKSGKTDIDYVIESGKKYHKIIMIDGGGSRSVHAFVDKKTGELYKSASWKAPAKGVRYDLRLIEEREWLLENADWAGGYLYAK